MSLQETPDEKVLTPANDNEPQKVLPVEKQMDAHDEVFEKTPTLTSGDIEKLTDKVSQDRLKESIARTDKLVAESIELEKSAPAPAAPQPPEIKKVEPEVKIAPDQVIEAKKDEPAQTLKETLKHSFVGDIGAGLERVKIGIASEPFIAAYESFYQWRHGRTVQKEVKMLGYKREADIKEEKLNSLNASIEASKKAGTYTAAQAKTWEKEKIDFEKNVETLRRKQDTIHARWEKSSNKDAYWRNRQKQVAEGAKAKLEEKARPYVSKFKELQQQNTKTEANLERYQTNKESWVAGLRTLESSLVNNPMSGGEKAMLVLKIERVKEILEINNKLQNDAKAESRSVASQMNSTNRRLSRWQGMSNEMARMGNRSHAPSEHEAIKEELGERHDSNFSHAPEPTPETPAPAAPEVEAALAAPAAPDFAPKQEHAETLQIKPIDYIKKWNELYGSDLKTDLKTFTDFCRIKPNESIDSKIIEDNMIKTLLPGVPLHKNVFEEGMRARFAKTREALKKK